ncbi:hypothetical protein N7509_005552 [Penicillium cosmopolitanum]|uniref:Extracellular membrane protein CFEM domain-containing protein n=1 Tax=Penicillium cosmopolitanum TaxID=1131564 RepID=A0A9W9W2F3_9EURO|nr:uncharacterized protein N7509_005552 [Penicillium cosmopolitanum]KAJ5397439.1 hypothetical protein N7509_005552 [Penicillium cosmopolitanum]
MRTSSLLYIFAFTSYVVAGDVDANDLPSQCQDVCAPVVSLTSSCDKKTNDDDTAELNCICKDSRAAKSLPDCDACISKYSKDGRDNDANDLVRSCSFTTTEYTAMTTSGSGNSTGFASMATATGSSSSSIITGSASSSGVSTASNAAATTSNAAASHSDPKNSIMGAVFFGLMAFVA